MRMPNVRNRVARLNLLSGEGELNIAMPRQRILHMAQTYGTAAGRLFVKDFVAGPGEIPRPAWREHQWLRLHTLLQACANISPAWARPAATPPTACHCAC